MAILSMFYGIIVSMYYLDNNKHHLPHIHVSYQEFEVILSIPDGSIIEGSLPKNKQKLVDAWLEIHQDELIANWKLASVGTNVFPIDPLK